MFDYLALPSVKFNFTLGLCGPGMSNVKNVVWILEHIRTYNFANPCLKVFMQPGSLPKMMYRRCAARGFRA